MKLRQNFFKVVPIDQDGSPVGQASALSKQTRTPSPAEIPQQGYTKWRFGVGKLAGGRGTGLYFKHPFDAGTWAQVGVLSGCSTYNRRALWSCNGGKSSGTPEVRHLR